MQVLVLNNFAIGQTHLGKSVFAARTFKKGDVITQFRGNLFHKSEIPKKYKGEEDRYIQIGLEHFLGPSDDVDDLINHSCEPNSGLKFGNSGILLVALQNIEIGDEIVWDYSTTLFENSWKMKCDCRKETCRGIVQDFMLLNPDLQKRYYDLEVIPPYIREYMDSPEYDLYTKGIASLQHGKKHK